MNKSNPVRGRQDETNTAKAKKQRRVRQTARAVSAPAAVWHRDDPKRTRKEMWQDANAANGVRKTAANVLLHTRDDPDAPPFSRAHRYCSICGFHSHLAPRCPKNRSLLTIPSEPVRITESSPANVVGKPRRHVTCSSCQRTGHNVRSCPSHNHK